MKRFLSFIFLLTGHISFGQVNKTVDIPIYQDANNSIDTSLWYTSTSQLRRQINLPDLLQSTDSFHFRFWTDIQAIDIWTTDNRSYFGTITNYARRYDNKLLRKGMYTIGRIYSNQTALNPSKARQFFDLITTLSITTIPTDEKINGWQQGFDGEEFLIETATAKRYDFKTYWTPRIFTDSLKEAKQIQTLVDYLYNDFKIYDYYKKLKLPMGSYQANGMGVIKIGPDNQNSAGATSITDLL